jgi:4-carboxymuconolactone decarboxylase
LERFPELTSEEMTQAQAAAAVELRTARRPSLRGPYNVWLRSPDLARRLGRLGDYLRWETSIPFRLNEFAILLCARAWDAQYEWNAHYPLAMKAGLRAEIAEDVAAGHRPRDMHPDEEAVYDFCTQLRRSRQVDDAAYAAALQHLGEQGVVDLMAVTALYELVSMTLKVARTPLPPGVPAPLSPLA